MGLGKIRSFHDLDVVARRAISGDANLWCREFESGALDNPEAFWVPPSLYDRTAPRDTSTLPKELRVEFEAGTPGTCGCTRTASVPGLMWRDNPPPKGCTVTVWTASSW